jgi:anti-sigma factor RsiW
VTGPEPADLPCAELVELVTDYLDGALPADWRARIDAHLATCAGCRSVVAQWEAVIRLGGRVADEHVEALQPDVRAALMAAFRSRAQPQAGPSSG